MRKLLLIDDDPILQATLRAALKPDFDLFVSETVEKARDLLASDQDFVLAIVDRRLPDGDGLTLVAEMRREPRRAALPVIFLSGLASESDRISGFFAGADDYVTKPFSVLELKARIMARLRSLTTKIQIGSLEIDLDSHRAHWQGGEARHELQLTRNEFKLLVALAQAMDEVVSRESLILKIWGSDTHVSDRVIDTHVSHLRKKLSLSDLQIVSLRKEGYRLERARAQAAAA